MSATTVRELLDLVDVVEAMGWPAGDLFSDAAIGARLSAADVDALTAAMRASLPSAHVDDLRRVARWLIRAGRLLHAVANAETDELVAAQPEADQRSLLVTAEAERLGLPLLALADDLARSRDQGLVVSVVWFGRGAHTGGLCSRDGRLVILLDAGAGPSTFAHELAHALDEEPDAPLTRREAFADALGPLLVEHEPATVAEVAPLIATVCAALEEDAARVDRVQEVADVLALQRLLALARGMSSSPVGAGASGQPARIA